MNALLAYHNQMVGASGIEPLTLATSKQCSAPELRAYDISIVRFRLPLYALPLALDAQDPKDHPLNTSL